MYIHISSLPPLPPPPRKLPQSNFSPMFPCGWNEMDLIRIDVIIHHLINSLWNALETAAVYHSMPVDKSDGRNSGERTDKRGGGTRWPSAHRHKWIRKCNNYHSTWQWDYVQTRENQWINQRGLSISLPMSLQLIRSRLGFESPRLPSIFIDNEWYANGAELGLRPVPVPAEKDRNARSMQRCNDHNVGSSWIAWIGSSRSGWSWRLFAHSSPFWLLLLHCSANKYLQQRLAFIATCNYVHIQRWLCSRFQRSRRWRNNWTWISAI